MAFLTSDEVYPNEKEKLRQEIVMAAEILILKLSRLAKLHGYCGGRCEELAAIMLVVQSAREKYPGSEPESAEEVFERYGMLAEMLADTGNEFAQYAA